MQAFFDSHTMSMLTFNKAEKAKKRQDLMDGLLRSAYPFISEGRALTSSLAPLELPYKINVLLKYLPEGEEDYTTLNLGQMGEKPISVKIWKDGGEVFCSHDIYGWRSQPVDVRGQEEVTLAMKGEANQIKMAIFCMAQCIMQHIVHCTHIPQIRKKYFTSLFSGFHQFMFQKSCSSLHHSPMTTPSPTPCCSTGWWQQVRRSRW